MRILFFFLFVGFSQVLSAQVLSGLYSGTLVNDSTKKEQRYELALSEYRGKITGYSYTTFVRNDSLFYGVKRIKGSRKNGQLVIEDDGMIANNFPEAPAKGVHQTNTIPLTGGDTLRTAQGTWSTNRTKTYYALSGGLAMKLSNDSAHSALIAQLKELHIISQPYYGEAETVNRAPAPKPLKETVSEKQAAPLSKNNRKAKQEEGRPQTVSLPYTERKKNSMAPIEISGDSLELAFYDNGVIDGDSISVYLNGDQIISHARLAATAHKKTVKLPAVESVEIILVAENLGTIPPNTGLLVIRDKDKTYQVNFSADLQTNAAMIIKRKLKQ